MKNEKTLNFLPYAEGVTFNRHGDFNRTLMYGTVIENEPSNKHLQEMILVESRLPLAKMNHKETQKLVRELERKVVEFWNENPNAKVELSAYIGIVVDKDRQYVRINGCLEEVWNRFKRPISFFNK